MKSIAILVPKGPLMPGSIEGAFFLLQQANAYAQQRGAPPPFEVHLLGYAGEADLYGGLFRVQTQAFRQVDRAFDLLLLPGFVSSDMAAVVAANRELTDWVAGRFEEQHCEVASMCTGGFLLGATGLLAGRKCAVHWAFEPAFQAQFPGARLQARQITTDDRGIYTSGGAYSSLNLVLYLIEKFAGQDTATWVARFFQLDRDRSSQAPFVLLQAQKNHPDRAIAAVQEYIEQQYARPLTVQALADRFAFSRRNFPRRFKAATGATPQAYLQQVRIEAAKRLLEHSDERIETIIGKVGYRDSKSFRECFKRWTGTSMRDYRERYRG